MREGKEGTFNGDQQIQPLAKSPMSALIQNETKIRTFIGAKQIKLLKRSLMKAL